MLLDSQSKQSLHNLLLLQLRLLCPLATGTLIVLAPTANARVMRQQSVSYYTVILTGFLSNNNNVNLRDEDEVAETLLQVVVVVDVLTPLQQLLAILVLLLKIKLRR